MIRNPDLMGSGFNTCSSCEEQPRNATRKFRANQGFNTCSSCEEQLRSSGILFCLQTVSIHAPLARSNEDFTKRATAAVVSIHAPLARSNLALLFLLHSATVSIHAPLARSNCQISCLSPAQSVSIHAPLARSNLPDGSNFTFSNCFNTCSSCEEQLKNGGHARRLWKFQYMLLLRGATISCRRTQERCDVSIHAPLARSNFLRAQKKRVWSVSIHAPLARSNTVYVPSSLSLPSFNTCSSCEEQPV